MALRIDSDCAGDPVCKGELEIRWQALTDTTPAVNALPVGLRPEEQRITTSVASIALYRGILAATTRLGRTGFPVDYAVNAAARDGRYPNGVPFCSFDHANVRVTAPFDPRVLRMVRRYLGVNQVRLYDIETVMRESHRWGQRFLVDEVEEVINEKYRSLWYQLLLQLWLREGHPVPYETVGVLAPEGDSELRTGFVDGFGNVFWSSRVEETGLHDGDIANINGTNVRCCVDFSTVELSEPALLLGYDFPVLVVGCESAAARFGIRHGDSIELVKLNINVKHHLGAESN